VRNRETWLSKRELEEESLSLTVEWKRSFEQKLSVKRRVKRENEEKEKEGRLEKCVRVWCGSIRRESEKSSGVGLRNCCEGPTITCLVGMCV